MFKLYFSHHQHAALTIHDPGGLCVYERKTESERLRCSNACLQSFGGVCMCVISWAQHQLGPLLPDRLDSAAHLCCSPLPLLLNLLSPTLLPQTPRVGSSPPVSWREWEQNNSSSQRWWAFQVNQTEGQSQHLCWIRRDHPTWIVLQHQWMHPYTSRPDSEREESFTPIVTVWFS